MKRRVFLRNLAMIVGSIAAFPRVLFARPDKAFKESSTEAAIKLLYPEMTMEMSDAVSLKAPAIAENGAVVPVTVSTDVPGVTNISILVDENPTPLAASFDLTPDAIADVSTRLKMGKTSQLTAVVQADGKLLAAQQEVKVTIGGCGG